MISRRQLLGAIPAALLLGPGIARATEYFTLETVKAQLFPDANLFRDQSVVLTKEQKKAIKKASKSRVIFDKFYALEAWKDSTRLGTLIIDQVYGKHEFITYAIALDNEQAVNGVEIMVFVETYGDEVRHPKWRAQFNGYKARQELEIDDQIKNISGATLSCVHITDGVRRVLITNQMLMAENA